MLLGRLCETGWCRHSEKVTLVRDHKLPSDILAQQCSLRSSAAPVRVPQAELTERIESHREASDEVDGLEGVASVPGEFLLVVVTPVAPGLEEGVVWVDHAATVDGRILAEQLWAVAAWTSCAAATLLREAEDAVACDPSSSGARE